MGSVQRTRLWGEKRSAEREEQVCHCAEAGVVVEAAPRSALEVIEPKLLTRRGLAVVGAAHRARVLPRDPDGGLSLLRNAGVVYDERLDPGISASRLSVGRRRTSSSDQSLTVTHCWKCRIASTSAGESTRRPAIGSMLLRAPSSRSPVTSTQGGDR